MQIDFKPEDMENYVKSALIKSSIGTAIQKAVNSILDVNSYNNPLIKELEKVIREIAFSLIQEKFTDSIKQRISIAIEKFITEEMIQHLTEAALEKMKKVLADKY